MYKLQSATNVPALDVHLASQPTGASCKGLILFGNVRDDLLREQNASLKQPHAGVAASCDCN